MRVVAIKYRICLISLMIFTLPYFAFAQVCSPEGYTILTINGINTLNKEAEQNKNDLHEKLPPTYNSQELNVDFVYNPTHLAVVGDVFDTAVQALFAQKSDYDLTEILNDASEKVTTQKLLLVAHSQGNFYGINFYDKVADIEGGVPVQSIGMYGVASPAGYVAGGGNYLTSDTDTVISRLPRKLANILPPNIHIPLEPIDGNGHSFSDVYLKYESARIVGDIKSALDKLQTNTIQDANGLCIAPQKLTLGHKIQGAVLAVADPFAGGTKIAVVTTVNASKVAGIAMANASVAFGNAVLNIAKKTANASIAFGNTVLKGAQLATNATVSAVSSVGKSIKNIALGVGAKNQANAIDAIEEKSLDPEIVNIMNPILPIAKLVEKKIITLKVPVTEEMKVEAIDVSIVSEVPVVEEIEQPVKKFSHGGGRSSPPPEEVVPPEEIVEEPPIVVPDTTPPSIVITGANPIVLKLNALYEELGATASDNIDGDITSAIIVSGAVDTAQKGTYTITYTATDTSGNTATVNRTVKVATYIYDSKYRFGSGNGDGNNWQAWYFNGTVFYDWSDTYVNNYLREQYTMKHFGNGTLYCAICIAHGIFKGNPRLGFEIEDLYIPSLERNLQWVPDAIYNVVMQWDATGYSYNMSHDGTVYEEGHIDIENVDADMYSGWSANYNSNHPFTVLQTEPWWYGVLSYFPEGYEGGVNMTLEPYPVYVE